MKLTKYCLLPWCFMQVHAGGMMQCCAVAPDTDIGDFILDYCEKVDKDPECDPFNNEGLQAIREGILTGNLRPMCRDCFFVANKLITTEKLREELIDLLSKKHPDMDFDTVDLRKVHNYEWMAISFTNRCNLSCVYCVQSVHKDTNPYFKMEFPYEYAEKTLDYFASMGLRNFSTCVEGEATLYKDWYKLFSWFHEKYPDIKLRMTTNLSRKYNDQELELLAKYRLLDISIDTLDPELFSQLRRNGNLKLILNNIDLILAKVEELGVPRPNMTIHTVLSDKTWSSLEELADYAFSKGIGLEIGDYEERGNTIAYQQGLIKPISTLPMEEQEKAYEALVRVKEKGEKLGIKVGAQGTIFTKVRANVLKNYNMFAPYDDNPIFKAFYEKYPNGTEKQYLSIVYDVDNISHEGIIIGRDEVLRLEGLQDVRSVVVREIQVYKKGTVSTRYDQNVMLRYRRREFVKDGVLECSVNYSNDNIEKILLEIVEYD